MAGQGSNDIYERIFGSGSPMPGMTAADAVFLNDSPEHEEIAERVMRDIEGSSGAFQSWEHGAREEDAYYFGNQWQDLDRMRMEQQKRPALTFNEIRPTINAVSGLERLNRVDINFKSRPLDSPIIEDLAGDLATSAVIAADDICQGVEEDSNLAKTAAINGMGWGEIRCDFDHDVNGRVIFEQFSSYEARWDPNSKKTNLDDSEWRARVRDISRKKFEKMWPGKLEKVDLTVPEMPYGQTQKYELVTPYYSIQNEKANPQVGGQTQVKKTVSVIQYQWRDMQPVYRFEDQDSGQITTLNEDKWNRLTDRMEMLGGAPPPAVRQMQPVYRQAYVCRGIVLEEPVDLPGGFSLLCMTGEWNQDKKRFVAIVRDMIDPQNTKNKAISSALGFHLTNAKGGVMFKSRLFADPNLAKAQWSQSDAWVEINDDADMATDFMQREPARMPPDLSMFYAEGTKQIARSSGLNEELIGQAAGQTPSQTSGRRVQAGLVVLGWYFDNLNRHRRERAQIMLEFIREFWTQGQLVQVGGDTTAQAIPLLRDSLPAVGDYTMVLDDSIRHNPNLKAQVWSELMESGVLQALMKFGMGQIILKLLRYSPFPTQLVSDIQKEVAQNPPQMPQKGRGMGKPPDDPMMTQVKIKEIDARTQKTLAQARQIDQQTGLKVAEIAADGMMSAHDIRLREKELEHKRLDSQMKVFQAGVMPGTLGGGQ